jgi:uroporphyrinogen-III synthase
MLEEGLPADVIPKQYVAESLLAELGDEVKGSRILLARAAIARDVLPEELARRGAVVDVVDAYRTVVPSGAVERMREVFSDASRVPDAVTFTSSSTVKHFFGLLREARLAGRHESMKALSIGPITSETLREFGWEPEVEAASHDVEGLVEAAVSKLRLRM